jgi:DNA-directed RNA polymerase specialized sigma24 family protein
MTVDEIVDAYYRKVYKLCLFYLRDPQEAEEVLQEKKWGQAKFLSPI